MYSIGMQERHLEPEEALPRLLVDQLDPLLGELVDRSTDVGDLIRHVVHPRPPLGQELSHRRLVAERRQQLHAAVADLQRCSLDALLGHGLTMLQPCSEDLLIRGHRLVEVVDRDAEMVDPAGLHAGDATCGRLRGR